MTVACWARKHTFQYAFLLDIAESRCNINSKVNSKELGDVCVISSKHSKTRQTLTEEKLCIGPLLLCVNITI